MDGVIQPQTGLRYENDYIFEPYVAGNQPFKIIYVKTDIKTDTYHIFKYS